MTRYYIEKSKTEEVLKELTREMTRRNEFINVDIRPYKGKKYNPQTTVVLIIG